MKVSILVLTYNHEKYLPQAIESVLMQRTNFDTELLISEDCSTDRTRDMVLAFKQKYPDKIRLLLSARNLNTNEVVVRGIRAARGQYIAYLDGDDYWASPYKLQKQVDFLDDHAECAMCCHNVKVHYEDGSREAWHMSRSHQKSISTFEDILVGPFFGSCSAMYRKNTISELPDWFDSCEIGDWALSVISAQSGDIGYVDEVLGVYRVHGEGLWQGMSQIQKLKKVIVFYEILRGRVNVAYNDLIRTRIHIVSHELAMEYEKEADLSNAAACLEKCILNWPVSAESASPSEEFREAASRREIEKKLWLFRHPIIYCVSPASYRFLRRMKHSLGRFHRKCLRNDCPTLSACEGHLDAAGCEMISGWAWDANRPEAPVDVDIYDGDIPLARVRADKFRRDLVVAGKGNGKHGFHYTVPDWLKDGKPHSIRVKVARTDFGLNPEATQIVCRLKMPKSFADGFWGQVLRRLNSGLF